MICRIQTGQANSKIKAFSNSNRVDEIISYEPCYSVKYESRKQGYDIDLRPIKLQLIKYVIGDEAYICCTTLLDQKKYTHHIFPPAYCGRRGIEELYKISKSLIEIEDFHSKTERGVKQECFAHILLINLARIFESKSNTQPLLDKRYEKIDENNRQSYWQDFCRGIKMIKINFKNYLLVIGRNLVKLFTMPSL